MTIKKKIKKNSERISIESLEMDLFMNSPAFICVLKGPNHIFRMANPEYEKITGKKDLIGKSVREVLPELEGQGFFEILDKVYQTGHSYKGNEIDVKLDRQGNGKLTDCYIDFSYQAYHNEEGAIAGVFVLGVDVTYQVEARKTVLESEKTNLFKAELLNAIGEAVISTDLNGIINFWNNAAEEIYGWTNEEAVNRNIVELLVTRQTETEGREIMHRLAEGGSWSGEFTVQHKTGRTFPVFVNNAPLYDDKKILSGIIGVSFDNSRRKKEIEELKYATNRMQLATRTAGMGIWDWDLLNDKLVWDEGMHRIFHNNEVVNSDQKEIWKSALHPDERERICRELEEAVANRKEYNTEYRIIWDDGSVHYVRASGMTELNRKGKTVRMIGLNWDITEQKEKEQQLKLMESVITNTSDSVLITDAESLDGSSPRIVYVNNAFTEMTGYTPEEVIGKTPKILQGSKTDWVEIARLKEALRQWQPCETTIINYRKNGQEFWINFSLTPVADTTGWFTHWIAIERDVTLRKNGELEKSLLTEISTLFNAPESLKKTLHHVLELVADFGDFSLAEIWLVSADREFIHLISKLSDTKLMQDFYQETASVKRLRKGEGLPGIAWENKKNMSWRVAGNKENILRGAAARKAGLQSVYGVPLFYNSEIIGVFLLGSNMDEKIDDRFSGFFESLGKHIGTEARRKQLEDELTQIFNSVPDIICIIGRDGFFKKINPAACELLGYSDSELMERPIIFFVHPGDRDSTLRSFSSLKLGSSSFYIENRFVEKSGKIKWLAWNATVSPDEGLIFAAAKDITEKKELGDLLNKANRLARIGSWEVFPENQTIYWSDMTREIHEADADFNPNPENTQNFFKEGKSRDLILEHMRQTFENGSPFDAELQIITLKGNEKWIRVIGDSEFKNGKIIRLYGSFQDIDTQKRNELAVNLALEERNTILESIGDGFFAVDRQWKVTYWNKQAEVMLNISREEIVGFNLWDIFKRHHHPVRYSKYQRQLDEGQIIHFETYLSVVDKWFVVSAYPSHRGLSVYFRDNTEHKISEINLSALHADIQKHAKDLAVSNAELEQFAYVASHDLQEPLRMITSYLTQIEKKYGDMFDEKGKKYMYFAVDGAKRMRQIILDLLEYSRAGRSQDKIEWVDLNEVIEEIRILFRKQISEKKAVIVSAKLPRIRSMTSPVRQIFQNLISNALKYTRTEIHAEISVGFSETKTYWQFSVKDNGIGIEKEYYEKIFIIFQRLHVREEFSGTGLGLAITKKIVENLGGTIRVESMAGEGSTFFFTLLKNPE